MAERDGPVSAGPNDEGSESEAPETFRPMVTRRDFIVGAGTGAVVVGVVGGGAFAATQMGRTAVAPAPVQVQPGPGGAAVVAPPVVPVPGQAKPAAPGQAQPAIPQKGVLPLTQRQVNLQIDGKTYEMTVDVRESLWDTMVHKLNMVNTNLGCDRAQCGACAVLVDGKAVNSCTVLSARMGRGQEIKTVDSMQKGPGYEGLHPIQKAFWQDGAFQCGICTRGMIVSTYALLEKNNNPTPDQIKEALGGNICRCGEYQKLVPAVQTAAAEMRGEKVTHTAPVTLVEAPKPRARAQAAASNVPGESKQFEFVTALATIEEFEPLAEQLSERPGILEVSGSERTITVKWEIGKLDEAGVRRILTDLGRPVK